MSNPVYINAIDFIETLKQQGLVIVSMAEHEAAKDYAQQRALRKKSLSTKEIADLELLGKINKKIILLLLIGFLLVSCSKDSQETTNPQPTIDSPIIYNKLKAYNKNIYYENITSGDWHKIKQNFDTINNTITQDSAQFTGPNIKKIYNVISSSYYSQYKNSGVNYMVYLISNNDYKYIMISHATNVNAVVFKKYKRESDIVFTKSSQDGEYYLPIK